LDTNAQFTSWASNNVFEQLKADVMIKPDNKDDWVNEPDVPTTLEIGGDRGENGDASSRQLEPNNIYGPWQSSSEYLKTMYGLFREDGIAMLRECVNEVRDYPSLEEADSQHKARIYESVST
jgi:hypothetical protein